MKLGISSYSLFGALKSGEMDILDVIEWVAELGGEHIEIVPVGFSLDDDPGLISAIVNKTREAGIEISNYAIGANFITSNDEEYEQEIERVKKQVDIANQLGVKLMRHDVAWRPPAEGSIAQFEEDLPKLVHACQIIADYASNYGITTSIENHGFYVQSSERVQTLINHVNKENFKTTLDSGNFLCVDEDPVSAVKKNISYSSMVHFKDFYVRPSYKNPGNGWFKSSTENHLRGAIFGHGDIDVYEIVRVVKASGYNGYISIEFEGLEDCKLGAKTSFENVKRIWDEV
jgi:sugar phosphate isomerase/epimerase